MLSKLNFNSNNIRNSKNVKSNLLAIEQQTREYIKKNDKVSISNSLNITKKIHQNNRQTLDIKKINNGQKPNIEDMYSIKQITAGISNKINCNFVDSSKFEVETLTDYDSPSDINIIRENTFSIKPIKAGTNNFNFVDSSKFEAETLTDNDNLHDINIIREKSNMFSIKQIKAGIGNKINFNFVDTSKFDISLTDNDIPRDINIIRGKGVNIINNVYQSKYNYGKSHCTGLGDFIRGSYFILEFCDKYGFQSKIVFNNCIAKFLHIKTYKLELIQNVLRSIDFFKANNIREYNIQNGIILDPIKDNANIIGEFVEYMVKSPIYYSNVFMFCNSFPMGEIPEKNKEYMRSILEPTAEMKQHVYDTLEGLNLSIKGYIVIHVRSGDNYLKNDTLKNNKNIFNEKYIEKLVAAIRCDMRFNNNNNYLIIADNNSIKLELKNVFPHFKILIKEITHFGEGVILEEEKVKNSLIDFYLLSYSSAIFSYSYYEHGSGFSSWCAKTYNIPYMCRYVR